MSRGSYNVHASGKEEEERKKIRMEIWMRRYRANAPAERRRRLDDDGPRDFSCYILILF